MRILFRVNVKHVGYGHLKRCLSIAEQLICNGYKVEFYVDDITVSEIFPNKDITFIDTTSDEYFLENLKLNVADIIILDGYFADENYVRKIKSITNQSFVIIVDSLKKGLLGADLLINPGFYANEYYASNKHQNKMLLGPEYTILGNEYKQLSEYKSDNVQAILITMGGMDPKNITLKLLPHLLLKYPNIKFYVVVGKYFSTKQTLLELKENNDNLFILENLNSLKQYILLSDLCISAAGTTVFEIARCSTPILLFAQDQNQLYSSHFWGKTNGVINFGYYDDDQLQQYFAKIEGLINNKQLRINMSEALKNHSTYGTATLVSKIVDKYNFLENGGKS